MRGPSCGKCVPTVSLKSSMVIEPATATVLSSTHSTWLLGRSNSFSISPTISSSTSCDGHDPGRAAVLVDDDRHRLALLAQLAQQRAEVLGDRHDRRLAGELRRPARHARGEQVAEVHDADEVVERLAPDREARVRRARRRRPAPRSPVSDASSQTTSGSGTITSRTSRDAKSNTLCRSSSCARGITPWPSASSTSARSSSADRIESPAITSVIPNGLSRMPAEPCSTQTTGRRSFASSSTGRDTQEREQLCLLQRQRLRHELAEDDAQVGDER